MPTDFQWNKLRVGADIRHLMQQAVEDLNRRQGTQFHLIKQPFGKMIACPVNNLWFFHISQGGRPPIIWTMAITLESAQPSRLPAQKVEDFEECCQLLGLQGDEQRRRFRSFLQPNPDRVLAPTAQGTL